MPQALRDLTPKGIRSALKQWKDATELGQHPLANSDLVEEQRRTDGLEDTVAGRGLAVRTVLRGAIDSLAPEGGPADPQDRRWRPHLILKKRYIDGLSPDYIAGQMAIARSTYNHEQLRAEKRLISRLIEWAEQGSGVDPAESSGHGAPPKRATVPFMAPQRRSKGLVGRSDLVGDLRSALTEGSKAPRIVLDGLPGVGKTAVAIELAHDPIVRQAYPDGVLWVGFGQSADLSVLLNLLANALEMDPDFLAALDTFEDRVRAVHSVIGSRRMLLVLDDVWRERDALAFQLAGPTCATIITTRFPGIARALADFDSFKIAELSTENSLRLLEQYAPSVVRIRKEQLQEAITTIGGLPLAIVLVGGYLRREAHSGQSRRLADALRQLRAAETWGEVSGPLSALDQRPGIGVEQEASLFKIIAMSEAALAPGARNMLYALGCFPPKPATFHESLLLSVSRSEVHDLDALVDAGLVEPATAERYRVHGAIKQFASAKAADLQIRERFVGAVRDYAESNITDMKDWSAEAPVIGSALRQALEGGHLSAWSSIGHRYFQYLSRTGLFERAIEVLTPGLDLLEQGGSISQRILLEKDLGFACQRSADYQTAMGHFEKARELAEADNDAEAICASLQGMGAVAHSQGEFERAEDHYRAGLVQAEDAGLIGPRAGFLSNLGSLAISQGDLDRAESQFERGLELARKSDNPTLVGLLLSNLGMVYARHGDFNEARSKFHEGLSLAQEHGDRGAQVALLINLGTMAHEQEQMEEARDYFDQALELARKMDDPARICQLLANLGALATGAGRLERSKDLLAEGLIIAERIGHREHQVLLHINLADLHKQQGNTRAYEAALSTARSIATEIDHRRYLGVLDKLTEA